MRAPHLLQGVRRAAERQGMVAAARLAFADLLCSWGLMRAEHVRESGRPCGVRVLIIAPAEGLRVRSAHQVAGRCPGVTENICRVVLTRSANVCAERGFFGLWPAGALLWL